MIESVSAIDAFDQWWNTRPEPHIASPKQSHIKMQQDRMLAIWLCAFESGRQQGIKQERALWELSAMTQEFEK